MILASGPYSAHLNPWLAEELKRETGLKIAHHDVKCVMDRCGLRITCVLFDKEITFALLRDEGKHEVMIAAIKLERVGEASWTTLYDWLFSCPPK